MLRSIGKQSGESVESVDSPDCLLILLGISIFLLFTFFLFSTFLAFGSVWTFSHYSRAWLSIWPDTVQYDTIDDILTCAQKPTWFSFVCRTEPTTEKWKTENYKVKTDMLRINSKQSGESGNPRSQSWRRKGKAAMGRICKKKEG